MKIKITWLVILVNSALTSSLFIPTQLPEDATLNYTQLGVKYGHKVEEHTVVTEDGYILTLFRMPGKRKTPVFLMHGSGDSSDAYMLRGNKSMAISLANEGYDVWAGNGRGNYYSRRHVKLDPDTDPSFWDYSFHERGYYDLPAIIDYILEATGEKSLQSIAHSQGTMNFFVLLSSKPEYNDKLKVFIAMAPIAYLHNLIPPVSIIGEIGPFINQLIPSSVHRILDIKGFERSVIELVCTQEGISDLFCVTLGVLPASGFDPKRLESSFLPILFSHYPAAISRKNLLHHNQLISNKRFMHYDYGPKENMKRYGFAVPPEYNLRKVTAKIAIFFGNNDNLSRPRDVEYLRTLLPNVVEYHLMKEKEWSHIDFIYGNDMPETLFPYIFQVLEKYS
ncbi:lipase 1-like [Choristoneura fumiferana]|uniref:lipase 1-like n=1 Tax=Choristoneura fumiferana TaxID=7141 RepID=UPI003D154143